MEREREGIVEPAARDWAVGDRLGIEHCDSAQLPSVVEERTHQPAVVFASGARPRHEHVLLGDHA